MMAAVTALKGWSVDVQWPGLMGVQGVVTAWNGKSCDAEWFFRTTDIIFADDPAI